MSDARIISPRLPWLEDMLRTSRTAPAQACRFGFLYGQNRLHLDQALAGGRVLALLFFEIDNFSLFANLFGQEIADSLMNQLHRELALAAAEAGTGCTLRFIEPLSPGALVLVCAMDPKDAEHLPDMTLAHRLRLKSRLKPESIKLTGQVSDILAGHGTVGRGGEHLEPAIYNALCDARNVAHGNLDPDKLSLLKEFREIVDNGSVMALYQPIVDLRRDRILGWEALCRGPEKSYFRSPSVLFDFAEDSGLLFSLEKACRDAAIRNLGNLDEGQKLFLNIHPRTLVDPHFSPGETVKLLAEHGLEPGNVVFEITERHSVREFTLFHRTLEHYRDQGFGVAIDDTGTGYSGLQSIAEIRPDFVKIDMGFVRDVDKDPVKRALIETFVALADKIGCRLVAEGIETGPELAALAEMGVHFGQGYYLARPKVPKPEVTLSGAHHLMVRNLSGLRELKCSIPIADLAEAAYTVAPHHKVSEVKELLGGDDPISSVVVADSGGRPLGLVMSHHLDRALSTRYGVSLYYHKPVIRIMDEAPLVVEAQTPVELVARKAMNRDKYKLYDHIVVTENGRVGGLASVQRILDTLALVQVEMARGANPLTGLPGNVAIERELGRRAAGDEPFAIIYADVDNFKAYNDTYGFRSGDNVLLMLAKILSWASRRHGDGVGDMVGHLGGDDFMLITSPERAERVCKGVVRCFSRLVRAFYSDEDLALGYVQSKDRNGRTRRFPMLSLSLAVVDCLGGCDPEEIGRRAAEMKTYAKSLSGNCHVRDRRGRVGPKRE